MMPLGNSVVHICIVYVTHDHSKTLDTVGNYQGLVFTVGVSRHIHKTTSHVEPKVFFVS